MISVLYKHSIFSYGCMLWRHIFRCLSNSVCKSGWCNLKWGLSSLTNTESNNSKILTTRMWANAQRDGLLAEYRWLSLFNAAKFGWRPLLECRAATQPRREARWNLQGCSKLPNRSQPLVGRSSPYYEDMWRRHWCLTSFFPTVDTCLSCEDIARQSCVMVPRWRIFGDFWVLHFQRTACSTFQTCILNSH